MATTTRAPRARRPGWIIGTGAFRSTVTTGLLSVIAGLSVLATDIVAPVSTAEASEPRSADGGADERRDDLAVLVDRIRAIHPDPFLATPEADFDAHVEALEARLETLTDVELLVELQRLVALLHDGHSAINLGSAGSPFDLQYPVVIYPFDDGVYVTGANAAYARLVGGRVVRIGDLPVDDALARIRDAVSGENELTYQDRTPNALTIPPLLHALGISPDPDRVEIEVETGDGSRVRETVAPVAASAFTFVGPEVVGDDVVRARTAETPLHLRDPRRTFWYELLADEKLLYVQLNAVRNEADESLRAFFERVFALADEEDVETFVLDIRYNHGGNNQLLRPLIHGLIRRNETIGRPGHLYTIIGRGTFSAAVSCTAWLEEHTNVRFVGEPTSSGPNHFGDAESFTLPHSGARVWISAWRWQTRLPWDDRVFFAPAIAAPPTFADYVAGVDPSLEAIRLAGHAPALGDVLRAALEEDGVDAARERYVAYKAEHPDRWGVTTEAELNALGYALLEDDAVGAAVAVFTMNAETYPSSANTWDSLAEGHLRAGDRARAIALYEKALQVDPGFENARRMLAELTGSRSHDGGARGGH